MELMIWCEECSTVYILKLSDVHILYNFAVAFVYYFKEELENSFQKIAVFLRIYIFCATRMWQEYLRRLDHIKIATWSKVNQDGKLEEGGGGD